MDERVPITVASIGAILAIFFAILYFMKLPIFDRPTISWFFVLGLASGAAGLIAVAVKSIWENRGY